MTASEQIQDIIDQLNAGTIQGRPDDLKTLLNRARNSAKEQAKELKVTDELLESQKRVIEAIDKISPCESHGKGCIPNAVDFIEKYNDVYEALAKKLGLSELDSPPANRWIDGHGNIFTLTKLGFKRSK